jgi:hypothetical protein
MSSLGVLEWSRTFDIVPNEPDIIFRILVDSEGMIGVSGIAGSQNGGGTVFVFRYNPFSNTVLWAVELISTSVNYNMGMIQLGPGGNYLVTNNPTAPNVAELVMLNRVTGAIIPAFSKHYDLGSSETMYDMVLDGGSLYAAGRFTDGGGQAQMRNTVLKLNPSNVNVD